MLGRSGHPSGYTQKQMFSLMKSEIKRHQIRASIGIYPKAKVNCGRQYKLGTFLLRKPDKCSATLGQTCTMYLLQFMQPGRYSGTTAPILNLRFVSSLVLRTAVETAVAS